MTSPIDSLIESVLESAKDATERPWKGDEFEIVAPREATLIPGNVKLVLAEDYHLNEWDAKYVITVANSAETLALALQDALVALRFYGTYSPRQHPEGYYEIHISPGMGGEDRFGTRARETLDRINEMVKK